MSTYPFWEIFNRTDEGGEVCAARITRISPAERDRTLDRMVALRMLEPAGTDLAGDRLYVLTDYGRECSACFDGKKGRR